MNTRKDFQAAANLVRAFTQTGSKERKAAVDVLVRFFAQSNPRFDATRFVEWVEA